MFYRSDTEIFSFCIWDADHSCVDTIRWCLGRVQKQNGLKICVIISSSSRAKPIHRNLTRQSTGNGKKWNLSSLKIKLISPSRVFLPNCVIVCYPCDCTEGPLADVHSLLLLYIVYTFTVTDDFTEQKCQRFLGVYSKWQKHHVIYIM